MERVAATELKSVEFSRIGQGTTGVSRSFDITLTKLRDDSQVTFLSIDKEEQKVLMNYFKQSGIKTRILDADGAQREVNFDSEDGSAAMADGGRSGRQRRPGGESGQIDADMDDEEGAPDGHASGGSRAARKRAKKRLRKMSSDDPGSRQPSKRPKQASTPTPVATSNVVPPASIMRFDEVLSAQSSEEVA